MRKPPRSHRLHFVQAVLQVTTDATAKRMLDAIPPGESTDSVGLYYERMLDAQIALTEEDAEFIVARCASYKPPRPTYPKAAPGQRKALSEAARALPVRLLAQHMRASLERVRQIRRFSPDGLRLSTVERWMEGCRALAEELDLK